MRERGRAPGSGCVVVATAEVAPLDDIARIEEELAALPPAERALLGPRATQKRKAELCAGRRAARLALLGLIGTDGASAVIIPDVGVKAGRPVARLGERRLAVFLSITHAGARAAAAAASIPVGVDLVVVEPQPAALLEEAFADGESEAIGEVLALAEHERVAAAFALKEAALKLEGVGLRRALRSFRVVIEAGALLPVEGLSGEVLPLAARIIDAEGTRAARGAVARSSEGILALLVEEPTRPRAS